MRLLVLSPTFYPHKGGAESLFDDLVRVLAAAGHQITVFAEVDGQSATVSSRCGAEVHRIRYPRLPNSLRSLPAFLHRAWKLFSYHHRLVRDRSIETVCIARFDEKAWSVLALRCLRRFRLVVYLHGGEVRSFSRDYRRFRWALKLGLRLSDVVVAVSHELGEEALAQLPTVAGKLRVIANGVDVAAIAAQPPFEHVRRYILYAGRLARVKNVRCIVEAFAPVCAKHEDVDLIVAGEGEQLDGLQQLVTESGLEHRIHLLGATRRETVFSLMKGAEFVVLSSLAEGHPIVIVEALAAGKAVLGSNVKGIRDVIVDGENGALFNSEDRAQLTQLMLTYLEDGAALAVLEENIARSNRQALDLSASMKHHLDVLGVDAREHD